MSIKILLAAFFVISSSALFSQEESLDSVPAPYALDGYISNMQSVMFDSLNGSWTNDNIIHNRLNFSWFPSSQVTLTVQVRNRLLWGESVKSNPEYATHIEQDNGYLQLSKNLLSKKSFVLNSVIDRIFLEYSADKFDAKLGRQRINWGQTMVWNPNDIFNNYSFFDFDYVERPGSDALRLQYYPTSSSTAEFAVKVNNQKKTTAAVLYRFNQWSYDFQFLSGLLNTDDFVVGTGWSGAISSVSFRGELTYFKPTKTSTERELFLSSLSFDYSFPNSSMILIEGLYSNFPKNTGSSFAEIYSAPASVKNLSFTKYNFLAQYSYPITPLLNASLSAMLMPDIQGYYVGPTITYSLKENLELAVFVQGFSGKLPDPNTGIDTRFKMYLGFIRLKANF